jgi:hypothetical protein
LSGRRVKPRIHARIAGIRRRVLLDFWFGFSLLKQIAAAVISPPCAAPRCRFSDRSSRSVSPSFVSDWSVLNLKTAGRTRPFTSSRILHPRVRLPTPRFARGAPLLDLDSCSTETPRLVFLCRFLRSSSRFHFDFSWSAPGGLDESPLQRLGSWVWTAIFSSDIAYRGHAARVFTGHGQHAAAVASVLHTSFCSARRSVQPVL